jgi:hypothetical protein
VWACVKQLGLVKLCVHVQPKYAWLGATNQLISLYLSSFLLTIRREEVPKTDDFGLLLSIVQSSADE